MVDRQEILKTCQDWERIYHEGSLLKANLFRLKKGMKEVVVSDWENEGKERTLVLNSLVAPNDHIAGLFRRSRKLRLGEKHAERMLKEAEFELSACAEQQKALEAVDNPESLAILCAQYGLNPDLRQTIPAAKKVPVPAKPYHTFVSQAGIEIWVGKSAKENDLLSFHFAHGLDFWLHAHDYPGSHVVIRTPKGAEPDNETLLDAAELAFRHSKAKNSGGGEVCVAQVKSLRSVKGCPGKVMVSKPKIIRITLSDSRWTRLKSGKR